MWDLWEDYSFIPCPIGAALLRSVSASSLSYEGLDLKVIILSFPDRSATHIQ